MPTDSMQPTFFSNSNDFRKWFEKNHEKAKELLVGFYKVTSGKKSITWPESVDEAICFGWIDGVRKSIDSESYCIRFTHRKPGSIWSTINIKKVEALTKKGLIYPAGHMAFSKRQEKKSAIYSYEKKPEILSPGFLKKLKTNKKAWAFFQTTAPSYQRVCAHWIMTAKHEATKLKRLEELINDSTMERKIKRLNY